METTFQMLLQINGEFTEVDNNCSKTSLHHFLLEGIQLILSSPPASLFGNTTIQRNQRSFSPPNHAHVLTNECFHFGTAYDLPPTHPYNEQ
jgi:hypothetical protein